MAGWLADWLGWLGWLAAWLAGLATAIRNEQIEGTLNLPIAGWLAGWAGWAGWLPAIPYPCPFLPHKPPRKGLPRALKTDGPCAGKHANH